MASIFKRGKIWWIKFRDSSGQRITQSTGQTDKRAAEDLKKYYAILEKSIKISGAYIQKNITFDDFQSEYMGMRMRTKSKKTLDLDRLILTSFRKFIGKNLPINHIGTIKINRWYTELLKDKAPATANIYLRHLTTFFNRAIKLKYLKESPCENVDKIKEVQSRTRTLKKEEVDQILALTPEAWTELIKIAIYTGARASELCRLKIEDLDLKEATIHIESNQKVSTKSKKFRIVTIPKNAMEFFMELLKKAAGHQDGLLLHTENGKPWKLMWISRGFTRWARKAGIKCTFHDLRRTYGAWLVMAGADLITVQENLGHSDISVTRKHYLHLFTEFKKSQTDKFPEI